MQNYSWARSRSLKQAVRLTCLASVALQMTPARADEAIGFYVGGAVGQAQVEASVPSSSAFKENHSAYKFMAGIRPISLIGAEVSYFDFGHPTGAVGPWPADVTMKGTAAFGLVYLPVPVVDVYAKAGIARIQSTLNVFTTYFCAVGSPNCNSFQQTHTNSSFAAGVGAQFKFSSLAVRAEYERFSAAGGNPGLATIGVTWKF